MTTGVMHVANFRQFRAQRMIDYNINEIYDFKKKIGEGAFGEVWEAYHIKGIMSCAIKIVKKQKLRKHQIYIDLMDQEL